MKISNNTQIDFEHVSKKKEFYGAEKKSKGDTLTRVCKQRCLLACFET